jgi:hypothetical protein
LQELNSILQHEEQDVEVDEEQAEEVVAAVCSDGEAESPPTKKTKTSAKRAGQLPLKSAEGSGKVVPDKILHLRAAPAAADAPEANAPEADAHEAAVRCSRPGCPRKYVDEDEEKVGKASRQKVMHLSDKEALANAIAGCRVIFIVNRVEKFFETKLEPKKPVSLGGCVQPLLKVSAVARAGDATIDSMDEDDEDDVDNTQVMLVGGLVDFLAGPVTHSYDLFELIGFGKANNYKAHSVYFVDLLSGSYPNSELNLRGARAMLVNWRSCMTLAEQELCKNALSLPCATQTCSLRTN